MFFQKSELAQSKKVTEEHFGLNFVSDFERIGDLVWETYDEVLEAAGITNVRYPGGITAEKGFDIKNPNAGSLVLADGSLRKTIGAFDFAELTREFNISVTFIIPTAQLLTNSGQYGSRTFDTKMETYVRDFVMGVLISSGGKVSTFEIGNEYETHMTSREYGRLVNKISVITKAAISEYNELNTENTANPNVAMQIWSQAASESTTMSISDLSTRAENAWNELNAEAQEAVDAFVTHWYAKDRDRSYIQTYDDLEMDIRSSLQLLKKKFEGAVDSPFIIVSEWNVNHHEKKFFGLAQVPIGIKMMVELIESGADQLDFWSAQYHSTSLALGNGDLTAIGTAYTYLESATIGATVSSFEIGNDNIGAVLFTAEGTSVVAFSNLLESKIAFDFDLSEIGFDSTSIKIGFIRVDTERSDGKFGTYTDLKYYNEPDLAGYIEWLPEQMNQGEDISLHLNEYQTVFVEISPIGDTSGAEVDDYFWATEEVENFSGNGGTDTVDYSDASSSVTVSLSGEFNSLGWARQDTFTDIENLFGSDYNDKLSGSNSNNTLNGGKGNDLVKGLAGNDFLYSENGIDELLGGPGNDTFYLAGTSGSAFGGRGDDIFLIEDGIYFAKGGAGLDTIDFSPAASGVFISYDLRLVEFENATEVMDFQSLEVFLGSQHDDTFTIYAGEVTAKLGAGDDRLFLGGGAKGYFSTGYGNDYVHSEGKGQFIHSGSGNDIIFSTKGTTVQAGRGDDRIYSFGVNGDEIIYNLTDGEDVVFGFAPGIDTFSFGDATALALRANEFEILETEFGSGIDFHNGGLIEFSDLSAQQVLHVIDLSLV